MKTFTRISCAVLALIMMAAFGACSLAGNGGVSADDAAAYIKGDLDAYYKGIYDKAYIDLVKDYTEADAKAEHQSNVELEAQYLMQALDIEYPTDAVTDKAEKLIEKIYAKADYTVGSASRIEGGDYAVEVKVKPIEIIPLIPADTYSDVYMSVLEEYEIDFETITQEDYEFIDGEYGIAILDVLESYLPQLTYGKEQTILFQIQRGEDGQYTASDTPYQTLDSMLIDYSGAYME